MQLNHIEILIHYRCSIFAVWKGLKDNYKTTVSDLWFSNALAQLSQQSSQHLRLIFVLLFYLVLTDYVACVIGHVHDTVIPIDRLHGLYKRFRDFFLDQNRQSWFELNLNYEKNT